MGSTGLGNTFNAVLEALYDADPNALKTIARQRNDDFLQDIAHSQKMLGELLALCDKSEVAEQLRDLGWLQAGLSELALSWQHLAMPLPKKPKKVPGHNSDKAPAAEAANEQHT
jgi:hypothetical protein